MMNATMLAMVEQCGEGVLVLVDGVEEAELLSSRLTRDEVQRQLLKMARTLENCQASLQPVMPEIDWGLWAVTARELAGSGKPLDEALWFACCSLVPATLSWLRIYRRSNPELFSLTR